MIPAYIISLANQQDRREHMRQECARVGIEATFIDASHPGYCIKKPKNNAGSPEAN